MTHDRWLGPLTMAALPGAARVTFSWAETADGVSYGLRSYDADGEPIGDGRDYELLRMVMYRLEDLASAEGFAPGGRARTVTLDLDTGALTDGIAPG